MSTPRLRPSLLSRKVVAKPWGGRALERVLGLPLEPGIQVGETWEVYDRPEGSSRMKADGRTLAQWMAEDAEALLGHGVRPAPGNRFPLLIKFIDAREALSVQVHPDDAMAAEEGDSGKTEAWVVLAAGPDARIIRGVRAGVERAAFAAVAHGAEVEGLLQSFTPRPGDAVRIPPGLIHAIGPDVVVYEVQQNSDVTYRLYDWGRPREVHLDKGLRAARFDFPAETTVAGVHTEEGELLVRNEHFTLTRQAVDGPSTVSTHGKFKVGTVVHGRGTIGWRSRGEDPPMQIGLGDTVLVPACTGAVFVSSVGPLTILWAGPP
ncbi:MAG TPA: type I phosphomannose isomerase catalytic subunit [Planctomycetota bacterium]|nr:type I phosphomannose isomerase catalytic subunit [Planctomycetota bacterium]